jgi:hypothetical protein
MRDDPRKGRFEKGLANPCPTDLGRQPLFPINVNEWRISGTGIRQRMTQLGAAAECQLSHVFIA